MPTLVLLRHAKSSWDDTSLPDHDRPLAARGRRAAPVMGRWLADHGPDPDAVLCSTSRRTRETLELFLEALGSEPHTSFDRRAYHASAQGLVELIRETDETVDTLMLVGHNPGMHSLAVVLAAEEGPGANGALNRMAAKFPTAALAVLEIEVDGWWGVEPGCARVGAFVAPKDLSEAEERRL